MRACMIGLAALAASAAQAQEAAPLLGPKPTFRPGYYETESRNSKWPKLGTKAKVCIASADFDAFRADTIAAYRNNRQFGAECALSDDKPLKDGFAFAMNCKSSKIVRSIHFAADLVTDTMRIEIPQAPGASSEILTVMHRVGDCPEGTGKPL